MNKTQKALLYLSALGALFSTQASAQYTAINQNQGAGIVMTENAGISATFLDALGTPRTDFSGYSGFGYYIANSDAGINELYNVDLSKTIDGSVYLGEFKAGDQIAFWLQTDAGQFIDSLHGDGQKGTTRDSAYFYNNGSSIMIGLGDIGAQGYGSISFDDFSGLAFNVKNGSPTPSGQPLPGALATLALAAFTYGGYKYLRRTAKQKD